MGSNPPEIPPYTCFGVYSCRKCGLELFNTTSMLRAANVSLKIREMELLNRGKLLCFEKPIDKDRVNLIPCENSPKSSLESNSTSILKVSCSKCQSEIGVGNNEGQICLKPKMTQLIKKKP